jgi:hypothetical protein
MENLAGISQRREGAKEERKEERRMKMMEYGREFGTLIYANLR